MVLATAAMLTTALFEPDVGVTVNQVGIVAELVPPFIAIVHATFAVIAKVSAQALKVGNAIVVRDTFKVEAGAAGCDITTDLVMFPDVTITTAYLAVVVVLATAATLIIALLVPAVGVTVSHVGIVFDVPEVVEDNVSVQLALDVSAKVSATARYDDNVMLVRDTLSVFVGV